MGARPEDLLVEERVIHDAWTYDTASGNGIWDMLVNERYADAATGLNACRQLGSPKLDLYVETIAATFRGYEIDCFDSDSVEAGFHRGEPPRQALEAAEQPFLGCIRDGAVVEAAQNYIARHIEKFRTRQTLA